MPGYLALLNKYYVVHNFCINRVHIQQRDYSRGTKYMRTSPLCESRPQKQPYLAMIKYEYCICYG